MVNETSVIVSLSHLSADTKQINEVTNGKKIKELKSFLLNRYVFECISKLSSVNFTPTFTMS